MLLILFCLFTTSCIKQMNLYQGDKEEDENGGNASTNQEVICEPDFLYPFDKETQHVQAEIIIHTKTKLSDVQTMTAQIPPLKYNHVHGQRYMENLYQRSIFTILLTSKQEIFLPICMC